jgi:FixJ family two-component response regulator
MRLARSGRAYLFLGEARTFRMTPAQMRVLVVDDALEDARQLSRALSAADPGLVIDVFPSAEEAMLASGRETVNLLVSSIHLPGISGADLARRMRRANPELKVILISGVSQEQMAIDASSLAVDGFFSKPFQVAELVGLAQRCLPALAAQPQQAAPLKKSAVHTPLDLSLHELLCGANAAAAWLYRRDGAYLAGVGDLPQDIQNTTWVQAAISCLPDPAAALRRSAAQQRLFILKGGLQDLILAAQDQVILALLLKKRSSVFRLALAFEEVLRCLPILSAAVHDQISAAPQGSFVAPQPEMAPPQPVEVAVVQEEGAVTFAGQKTDARSARDAHADLSHLASILDSNAHQAAAEDIDAFWEEAADSGR